jgi:biopolymer transport protein ExbD
MKLDVASTCKDHSDNNLIPMINVVFLLLIFFMLAGTIRASDPIKLKPLESTHIQSQLTTPAILFMSDDGSMFFAGKAITLARLPLVLNSFRSDSALPIVTQGLTIKVDSLVTIGDFKSLLTRLREAGLQQVELVTIRAQEKNTAPST